MAVWAQTSSAYYDIFINRYTPANGWGTETLVANGNQGGANNPQLAFDANGNATLVWHAYDGTRNSLYANRYTAGTNSWGTEVLLESGNNGHARTPKVAVDSDGNAIAVWVQEENSAKTSVYVNRYTAATDSWGTETLIESSDEGNASAPQIAINDDGNAVVIWLQDDSIYSELLYTNFYNMHTNSWGTETLVESTTVSAYGPKLVMDDDGNATAVTYRYDGTNMNIHANRFE